jgi:hypothetical protein
MDKVYWLAADGFYVSVGDGFISVVDFPPFPFCDLQNPASWNSDTTPTLATAPRSPDEIPLRPDAEPSA